MFGLDKTVVDLPNAQLVYIPDFYSDETATRYFQHLKEATPWQQDPITIFGTTHLQPRLTALYATHGQSYKYSNITMDPHPFTKELLQIKQDVEQISKHPFTSVLLNLYRSGSDSNGWHADNEPELGTDPTIASLSLGQERWFHFKHRTIKTQRHKLLLAHGSLLIMAGAMQHHWLHQIPKTKRMVGARINLTFRTIKEKVEVPQPRLS